MQSSQTPSVPIYILYMKEVYVSVLPFYNHRGGHHCREHMVVGFTTTYMYAISAYQASTPLDTTDTTLCDSLSVTCSRSVVFSGFLHQ